MATAAQHVALSLGLAGPIHPQGIYGLLRPVRTTLPTTKHKIRTHLQQAPATRLQRCSEGRRCIRVHRMGQSRLTLGLIHRCVGPSIDQPIRLLALHQVHASRCISQIQLLTPHSQHAHPNRSRGDQSLAQLTRGAGDYNTHVNS